jgi:hypothetical protein
LDNVLKIKREQRAAADHDSTKHKGDGLNSCETLSERHAINCDRIGMGMGGVQRDHGLHIAAHVERRPKQKGGSIRQD